MREAEQSLSTANAKLRGEVVGGIVETSCEQLRMPAGLHGENDFVNSARGLRKRLRLIKGRVVK